MKWFSISAAFDLRSSVFIRGLFWSDSRAIMDISFSQENDFVDFSSHLIPPITKPTRTSWSLVSKSLMFAISKKRFMQTKTKQEEAILKEIRDLPEMLQEKIFKMILFFRSEIIENRSSNEIATAEFLSVCGTWKDTRSVEKQIDDIYSSRKSTNRSEKIF